MTVENTLFEKTWTYAQARPDKIIARDATQCWTWSHFLSRAFEYKDRLQKSDDNSFVPIFVDRSIEFLAAALGCLLAGKAYAPLSPQQPFSRIEKCLLMMNPVDVIDLSGTQVEALKEKYNVIEKLKSPVESIRIPPQPKDWPPNRLLYVLFTSGSTGTPKGVLVNYSNIVNTMEWSQDVLPWQAEDVIGIATNFFFDISQFDFYTALFWNVPVTVLDDVSEPQKVLEQIAAYKVTSLFSAPVFYSQLLRFGGVSKNTLGSLRRILSGGDFFPQQHMLAWMDQAPQVTVMNVWGPTETSIVNTMHVVTDFDRQYLTNGKHVPVGKAMPRMPFCLIDEKGNIIDSPNVTGEICMLDECVTQGYLKDKERTDEVYVEINGRRAFKTRDLGFLDDKKNLFIIGRMGSMAKINGYRVDLGEVETALCACPNVMFAAAFVQPAGDDLQELWVGIELKVHSDNFDIFPVKQQLRKVLPSYMVPKKILTFKALPKNQNGKIDRKTTAVLSREMV